MTKTQVEISDVILGIIQKAEHERVVFVWEKLLLSSFICNDIE
jgi:hypothetical protein